MTNADKIDCVKMLNESLDRVYFELCRLFPEISMEKSGDLMYNDWSCRLKMTQGKEFGV